MSAAIKKPTLMKWTMVLASLLAAAIGPVDATALNVSITGSTGASSVTVAPGAPVAYRVTGVLGNTLNEGLAAFSFDLHFSAGALPQAATPLSAPMTSFVLPNGLTNPAGFGGTIVAGDLIGVGGMQNVLKNTPANAPAPIGIVILGIGHAPQVLVTGTFTAPATEGSYTLELSNLVAAVIRDNDDGIPNWNIDLTEENTVGDLTVIVSQSAPAGAVPDGSDVPGVPLTVSRSGGANQVTLSWGASCNAGDTDYAIYRGTLGNFTSHTSVVCSTGGDTTRTFSGNTGNRYFLVVPRTPFREGSYGRDSSGNERPAAASRCVAGAIAACP